jgi:signal peptidase II
VTRPLPLGLAIALVVFVLDQASKWWLLEVVGMPFRRHVEVTPFFNLVMVWNRGVSFGMLYSYEAYMPYALSALAVAISAGLLAWLARTDRRLNAVAIGMIVGGAIGNVVDRLRFGAVADFFDVHVAGWHWPAFNVADSGITVGVAIILLDGLFGRHDKAADSR